MTEAEWLATWDAAEMHSHMMWLKTRRELGLRRGLVLNKYRSVAAVTGHEWNDASPLQADLMRCVFGNPFRPVVFEPDWRTSTVIALAKAIHRKQDWGVMPVLADALQDAGCEDEAVLGHLRGPGPHARGCWVVDGLLGKS